MALVERPPSRYACECTFLAIDNARLYPLPAGARVQTTVSNLDKAVLGTCGRFEERQVWEHVCC